MLVADKWTPLNLPYLDVGMSSNWRPQQIDALKALHRDVLVGIKTTMLMLPTGSGKTVVAIGWAILSGDRTIILTATKALQDQIEREFSKTVVVIKGRGAYPCKLAGTDMTAEQGICQYGVYCPIQGKCEYKIAMNRAKNSRIVVANYALWFSLKQESLGKFQTIVCDEAHSLDELITKALSVQITSTMLVLLQGIKLPLTEQSFWSWKTEALHRIGEELAYLFKTIKPEQLVKDRRVRILSQLAHKLQRVKDNSLWIVEKINENIVVDPLWPANFINELIINKTNHVVMMSATLTENLQGILGLSDETTKFYSFPSTFPVENRPFIWIPTCRVNYSMDTMDKKYWLNRINQIVERQGGYNGIIHTVSYDRSSLIVNELSTLKQKRVTMEIEKFKRTGRKQPGEILISPVCTTGYDFSGDECRWQLIVKLPFADLRRKVDVERKKLNPEFSLMKTMQTVTQISGRGVRSETDWCKTYIIDDHWAWFHRKAGRFAPEWFRDAWRKETTIR